MPRASVQRLSEAPAQQDCSRSGAEIIQRPVHISAFSLTCASAVPPISLNTSVLQKSAAKSSASWGLQAGSNPSTDCCNVAAHSLAASPTRKPFPPLPHRLDLPCRQPQIPQIPPFAPRPIPLSGLACSEDSDVLHSHIHFQGARPTPCLPTKRLSCPQVPVQLRDIREGGHVCSSGRDALQLMH